VSKDFKESDLAATVQRWLEEYGWDCYPEAQFKTAEGRADIAALKGNLLWIIECKTSFTLALLEQARRWIGNCHHVSVAVPYRSFGRVQEWFCRAAGIGILVVNRYSYYGQNAVDEVLRPRMPSLKHCRAGRYISQLHPDMKKYAPGSTADKGYSSPWKRTMDAAVGYIEQHPGCQLKEVIKNINHHYHTAASANGSLRTWLEKDKRVRVESACRPWKFYPAEAVQ
jgi:hypothetical protein